MYLKITAKGLEDPQNLGAVYTPPPPKKKGHNALYYFLFHCLLLYCFPVDDFYEILCCAGLGRFSYEKLCDILCMIDGSSFNIFASFSSSLSHWRKTWQFFPHLTQVVHVSVGWPDTWHMWKWSRNILIWLILFRIISGSQLI